MVLQWIIVFRGPADPAGRSEKWDSEEEKRPAIDVLVYGFEKEELNTWPADLHAVSLPQLDHLPGTPLVVHARAFEAFREEALKLGARFGRMPGAILYLPPGMEIPQEAWSYVDAVAEAEDWETLRELLRCPRRFESAEWTEEIPGDRLFVLPDPPSVEEIRTLPLPAEVLEHLISCGTCQEAFTEALRVRRRMARMLCPSPARLRTYLEGMGERWIGRHLERCAICRSEAEALFFALSLPVDALRQIAGDPERPLFLREWAIHRLRELGHGGASYGGGT